VAAADPTALRALSDLAPTIAAEHELDPVLQRLVQCARELARARYAALGIPDGNGHFASFITSGMSDELIAPIGPRPRTHGLLGATLQSAEPQLTDDIAQEPHFVDCWPRAHPMMRSFLGVPIVARGETLGAVYLMEKEDGPSFCADDETLVELLDAHAAIVIENARLHERSGELAILEQRNRLARELFDLAAQRLFGARLAAASAATLLARDPSKAAVELARLSELARAAMRELRAIAFELRAGSL
jgi:GAF domain-containing protein